MQMIFGIAADDLSNTNPTDSQCESMRINLHYVFLFDLLNTVISIF